MFTAFLTPNQVKNIPTKYKKFLEGYYHFVYIETDKDIEMISKAYTPSLKNFTPAPTLLQFLEFVHMRILQDSRIIRSVEKIVKDGYSGKVIDDLCETMIEKAKGTTKESKKDKEAEPF